MSLLYYKEQKCMKVSNYYNRHTIIHQKAFEYYVSVNYSVHILLYILQDVSRHIVTESMAPNTYIIKNSIFSFLFKKKKKTLWPCVTNYAYFPLPFREEQNKWNTKKFDHLERRIWKRPKRKLLEVKSVHFNNSSISYWHLHV